MRCVIGLALIPCLLIAEEPALSSKAQRIVDTYHEAIQEAEQAYLKAVQDAQSEMIKDLNREVSRLRLSNKEEELVEKITAAEEDSVKAALMEIASKKAQEAVLISEAQSELSANTVATDMLGNVIKVEKTTGKKPKPSFDIAGKEYLWDWNPRVRTRPITFADDGTVIYGGEKSKFGDTWSLEGDRLVIGDPQGIHILGIITDPQDITMTCHCPDEQHHGHTFRI